MIVANQSGKLIIAEIKSGQVSEQLLLDPLGQEALSAVHRFVSHNSEWVQRALGVTAAIGGGSGGSGGGSGDGGSGDGGGGGGVGDDGDGRPRLVPWGDRSFREPDPRDMATHVGERQIIGLCVPATH